MELVEIQFLNWTKKVRKEEKLEKGHITFCERLLALYHNLTYFTLVFINYQLLSLFFGKISAFRSWILKIVSPANSRRVIFKQTSFNVFVKHDLFEILALIENCTYNLGEIADFLSVSFKRKYFCVLIHYVDWLFEISFLKYV